MTREQCEAILPVIEAFAKGEHIEYWDPFQITGTFTRGIWTTAENIGFGRPISYYRMRKNGEVIYFGDKSPQTTN